MIHSTCFRLEYHEDTKKWRRNYGEHTPWQNGWATVLRDCDLDTYFAFMQWMDDRRPDGTDLFGVLDEWEVFAHSHAVKTFGAIN